MTFSSFLEYKIFILERDLLRPEQMIVYANKAPPETKSVIGIH